MKRNEELLKIAREGLPPEGPNMVIGGMGLTYFARIVGTTGAYTAPVNPGLGQTPNPFSAFNASATPARGGAGSYTLTFATALPQGEYLYELGIEGGAANANINATLAGAVLTVATAVAAVATDENWWLRITRINEYDSSGAS